MTSNIQALKTLSHLEMGDKNMRIKLLIFSVFIITALVATGCAGPSHFSENFGKSYNALFQAQEVNPDAPDDRTPVDGMPGYTATQIYNNVYLPGLI